MSIQSNPQLELAFEYVRNTHKNIFLTGKAGTGKTTFLHRVREESPKRMVVVAPTGVAAINAGGMTIHSFFQLPFGPFLPGNAQEAARQRRFSGEKIRLIQSLDLLVIDEISMVRADVLDAIDDVLRRYRDRYKPFGGVQLLMIGDLHQLPPVVKDEEWNLLRDHYQTAYFFGSRALRDSNPVCIELKHIYRQADTTFIDLLNKVRNNRMDESVLAALNSRYVPHFQPTDEEPYITLTAHNASAQEINAEKLASIHQPLQKFKAVVEGDFPEYAFPADEIFECKKDAQVMFVKNDLNREKRYFNGKIGKITGFREGVIYVRCPGEDEDIEVQPAEWTNVRYSLNEQTKEVSEEVLGTFTQYPLKLAWAITIHKSQGLTFERAIIDAQAAFAHGQVYVALSRCKSFEGIVLRSPIAHSSVKTDQVVKTYSDEAEKNAPDEAHLAHSKAEYQQSLMLELFDFSRLRRQFAQLNRLFLEHENTLHQEAAQQLKDLDKTAVEQVFTLAERFLPQIRQYFGQTALPEENEALQTRLQKAGGYFSEKLGKDLLPGARNIQILTDNKTVRKAAQDALETLQKEIFIKNACFAVIQEGFSATRYLRAKADAELDFSKTRSLQLSNAAASPGAPKNIPHPVLFSRLKKWRDDVAETNGVELYEVLPTRALLEIVQFLPLNLAALKKVKGIGAGKSQRFGADLIALVQGYCDEYKVRTGQMIGLMAPPEEEKPPKPDTKKVSFDLFRAGKTVDEIAHERALVPGTIEGHLAHFVSLGELDIYTVMELEDVHEIVQFFHGNNTRSGSEAKAHFGEKYSYGKIKMVLQYMDASEREEG
ncbi:MAG: helicase [Haliscomenobacteraceae bacterium CHB4]|nr:ATP-dependent RecD-like DNA helicase [Saprospiraceae bacterium]MCE7923849.1 helicase [Haliscomenobacteraceae bacterium CHB4]